MSGGMNAGRCAQCNLSYKRHGLSWSCSQDLFHRSFFWLQGASVHVRIFKKFLRIKFLLLYLFLEMFYCSSLVL